MARFGLPAIISQIAPDLRQFLDRVREFIDSATRGDNAFISRTALIDAGIAVAGPGNSLLPGASSPEFSTVPPPAPAGLFASGTLTSIYLTWNEPGYSNHSYSKVFRSVDDNFSNAVLIGSSSTRIFTDSTGMGADYYYWVQHVSKADVPGPVVGSGVGSSGVHAFTSADNTPMLNLLENAITAAHVQAESITGDRMVAATISASRMNVTELSAITANMGAVTAGSVTLDASGFVRGGSTGYLTGSGFWMGYHSTTYKFHIGNPIGEFIAWTGSGLSVQTPQFTLSGGNATFSGELSAATGTFGGGITGTSVIGEAQLAGSAVTAPKIAALQVQAGHMAANSITAANAAIADATITTAKIQNAAINNAKIADLSVSSGKIADLSVSTLKIQDQAVTIPVATFTAVPYGSTASAVIDIGPSPIDLAILASVEVSGYLGISGTLTAILKVNGAEIQYSELSFSTGAGDLNASGTITFNRKISGYSGVITVSVSGSSGKNIGIVLLGIKK